MCAGVYVYVRRCVCVWASYLTYVTVSVCPITRDVTQGLPSRKLLAARVTMVAFMTPKNAVEHP